METMQRTINGRIYSVSQMPTFKALDVFEILSATIGPGIAAIASLGLDGDVTKVAEALFAKLGGGKLKALANQLLDGALVEENGKTSAMLTGFDLRYAGKLFEVFQVMAFVVEVNYKDFFDGVLTLLGGLRRAPPAEEAPLQK
jgi:hypothetical protein